MLLIIRTEYDNSIIIIKIVSMLFLTKLRKRSNAPIQNLPVFFGLFPVEVNRNEAKYMPEQLSNSGIVYVQQLLIF